MHLNMHTFAIVAIAALAYTCCTSSSAFCWEEDGVPVCENYFTQQNVQVAPDGNGGAFVVWEDYRDFDWNIYAQRLDANGRIQWDADGVGICIASGWQHDPEIVFDGHGNAIIAWEDHRSGMYEIYAQKIDQNAKSRWEEGDVLVCRAADTQNKVHRLRLASDPFGGVYIAWYDWRRGNADVYVQRIDSDGTVCWADGGIRIGGTSRNDVHPFVVSSDRGDAVVSWIYAGYGGNDIYLQRISSKGKISWKASGVLLARCYWSFYPVPLVSDGADGVITTWWNETNSTWITYAQRLDVSGAKKWTPSGVIVSPRFRGTSPVIASNEAGGAIVAWSRGFNIYAQMLDEEGNLVWEHYGETICEAPNNRLNKQITPDGKHGAIIAWRDSRAEFWQIYAQKIDYEGNVRWADNGVPLCIKEGDKRNPRIVFGGDAGAIIAWEDHRQNSYDIYAMKASGYYEANVVPVDEGVLFSENEKDESATGIDSSPEADRLQCYNAPNPFNPSTSIGYYLPAACAVTLEIYDSSGKLVARLLDGETQARGTHSVEWRGADDGGRSVSSGVYFYRLRAGRETLSRKMVLLR